MSTRVKNPSLFLAALLAVAATSAPAFGGYTILFGPIDEIVERQSLVVEAGLLGDHALLEEGEQSVALHPFYGFYGEDGILVGAAASWHTTRLLPWQTGISVGSADMDVNTWMLGVSAQRQVWQRGRLATLLQGGVAYQRMFGATSDPTGITLESTDATNPYGDDVLFETLTLGHAMLHAIFAADLTVIRTVLHVGWVGTVYHFDANECGTNCFETGAPRSGSGEVSKTSWGLGASLGVRPAILSAGFKTVGRDAAIFQASVGWVF